MVHRLDKLLQRGAQDAYTYAWDRWGIYIGTVRLVLVTTAIVLFEARLPYDSPLATMGLSNKPTMLGLIGMVLVWSVMFYLPHGYIQRVMQREERWSELFVVSEKHRAFGPVVRIAGAIGFFVGVGIGYVWAGHLVGEGNILRGSAVLCIYTYFYSLGVHVGPRDRLRFPKKQTRLASA